MPPRWAPDGETPVLRVRRLLAELSEQRPPGRPVVCARVDQGLRPCRKDGDRSLEPVERGQQLERLARGAGVARGFHLEAS